eukprot:Skav222652  [mRNA]  locus=scaffold997:226050:228398:- [translate_table: standard]
MGFLNSVSLAQHVHRVLVGQTTQGNEPERELRKDRPFSYGRENWRIYLDNYDLLEKVKATQMVDLTGTPAPGLLSLRQQYEVWGVPRNLKKSVQRSSWCELQGATVDGQRGIAFPRETKLCRYFSLALMLCDQSRATQRQWQVVCGGLVYFSMFRRPLLGGLNRVWTHIESFNTSPFPAQATPETCRLEVLRFLGALPLARLDFRLDIHPEVTCSDASTSGGGLCVSSGLTPFGSIVAAGGLRGQVPEHNTGNNILSIGLFDGIGALRVALELLGAPVVGHISVEMLDSAHRVVETHFPGTLFVNNVEEVNSEMVQRWRTQFSQCTLIVLGAGPPCQGVSGLNADRRGALRDLRSCLFTHVPRVRDLLSQAFPWCPVHTIMESVQSMDLEDRQVMSEAFGDEPLACDAGGFTWCHRPRLYWMSWDIMEQPGAVLTPASGTQPAWLTLSGEMDLDHVTRPGWLKVDPSKSFPTFTTSRPREKPGRKPAGIQHCSEEDIWRWQRDSHRFPPYQYKEENCLVNRSNELRIPDIAERELMMGFPLHYTAPCLPKSKRGSQDHADTRLSLVGNSWNVPVVAWLLGQLLGPLGIVVTPSPQQVLDATLPGSHGVTQGLLARTPLRPAREPCTTDPYLLAFKLSNLVSMKGDDLLVSGDATQQVRHHRLRASIPSKLWQWRIVTGWRWKLGNEHINALELRAILTSLRWRVEHKGHCNTRLLHLTDSMVCLHCLTRGRSSSRKLRRTISRINALSLASNLQPLWGYVHTDQNPADKPSRWGRRVRTKFR